MTAGWGGVNLTASRRGGRWPLGGEGEVGRQQGWRTTAGRGRAVSAYRR